MSNLIKVYENGSIEKGILKYFASVFNAEMQNTEYLMTVENIYIDYDQDWAYTALITNKGIDSWQSLCPRDYENIISNDSFSDVYKLAIDYAKAISEGKISVHLTF